MLVITPLSSNDHDARWQSCRYRHKLQHATSRVDTPPSFKWLSAKCLFRKVAVHGKSYSALLFSPPPAHEHTIPSYKPSGQQLRQGTVTISYCRLSSALNLLTLSSGGPSFGSFATPRVASEWKKQIEQRQLPSDADSIQGIRKLHEEEFSKFIDNFQFLLFPFLLKRNVEDVQNWVNGDPLCTHHLPWLVTVFSDCTRRWNH